MVASAKTTAACLTMLGVLTITYQAGQAFAQAYFGLMHLVGLF
jgi:hypothetical protein